MFFVLSKILWTFFVPSTVLFIAIFGVLGLKTSGVSRRYLSVPLLVVVAIILVFPVGHWALGPLENIERPVRPPERMDGIVILGGAVDTVLTADHHEIALNDAAERLTVLPSLMLRYPEARVIFSGGSGRMTDPNHREADDVSALFGQWGIPSANIDFERDSRNTYENAVYSKRIAAPVAGQNWLLVTSAAHMRRALGVFRKAGWPVIPYAVDYRALSHPPILCFCALGNLQKLDQVGYELTGIAVYHLTGKL